MTSPREVLVALMKDLRDMNIAREQQWYRIPVDSINHQMRRRWPPKWLAFYQPKVFDSEAYKVNYYASVENISEVCRWELFPDEPKNKNYSKRYYKLDLSPLKPLLQPIISNSFRRIVFIQTTWEKLINAEEINDLWDESLLEDRLWEDLKRLNIPAERQEFITINNKIYALDFAIYCVNGKINVETDGDTWHSNKEGSQNDRLRDNELETKGWSTLRFGTDDVLEKMAEYCIPKITENINRLGGLRQEGKIMPRLINRNEGEKYYEQLTLF